MRRLGRLQQVLLRNIFRLVFAKQRGKFGNLFLCGDNFEEEK